MAGELNHQRLYARIGITEVEQDGATLTDPKRASIAKAVCDRDNSLDG
jgi:hypothetical protein